VSGGCKCCPIPVEENLNFTANVDISERTVCYSFTDLEITMYDVLLMTVLH